MTKFVITEQQKKDLQGFLNENRPAELINTYLYFIELKIDLQPVLFPKEKIIYQSTSDAIRRLENEGKLWHETEIKIGFGQASVNEETKKIYICPFTGKVFGDNTHPNLKMLFTIGYLNVQKIKKGSADCASSGFLYQKIQKLLEIILIKQKLGKSRLKKSFILLY